jgi:hypothetical protein
LAALRYHRIEAPWVLDGPIDGESFTIYVEKVLLRTLKPDGIVIMENLGSHKGNGHSSAHAAPSSSSGRTMRAS